jgi:hypothetical protein
MPFTQNEKASFIAFLQTKGWQLRDGIIWSPSGGLHLSEAHFDDWSPEHVRDMFAARSTRLEKYKPDPLEHAAEENAQASWAAGQVLRNEIGS